MKKPTVRLSRKAVALGVAASCAGLVGTGLAVAGGTSAQADGSVTPATPIQHLVVIFDENVSYDHYFGTYPYAANTAGETVQGKGSAAPAFQAKAGTPANENLLSGGDLGALKNNPNAIAPFRLTPAQAVTCDQNHNYMPEQQALDAGSGVSKMDKFVETVSKSSSCNSAAQYGVDGETMGYFDGNTVTGLWNYAQNYAMSDNSWDATFGPSTPGALNLVAGQTHGATSYLPWGATVNGQTSTSTHPIPDQAGVPKVSNPAATYTYPDTYSVMDPDANGVGTITNDPDPVYDDCNDNSHASDNTVAGVAGQNIGDLLSAKNVTWGWFQGGFTPTTPYNSATGAAAVCGTAHAAVNGVQAVDYSPHHNPFAYYASTSNPHHFPGTPGVTIGAADPTNDATGTGANHQYDTTVFDQAVTDGQLPAVSFVKAGEYQDGHAAYSDPIDEQDFLTHTIGEIQKSPEWKSTAIVIAYDDSDGWYDHVAPIISNGSQSTYTASNTDQAVCTTAVTADQPLLGGYQDRCGPSQRLPFLVISPYSKVDYIDHTETSQPSITQFIEDNWLGSQRVGDGSFDATAGSMMGMFDFAKPAGNTVVLNPNGTVASRKTISVAPQGGFATTLTATVPATAKYGQSVPVHFTLASQGDVTGGTVSATVDGKAASTSVAVDGTSGSVTLQGLTGGKHTVVLSFSGTIEAHAATVSHTITVAKAATMLTAKATKPTKAGKVTVTVTVSPAAATGTVSGKDNGSSVGTRTLSKGKATFSLTLKKGANKLVFTYAGNTNYAASTAKAVSVSVKRPVVRHHAVKKVAKHAAKRHVAKH